jgi:predicted phosphoserine aminotransferase
MHKKLFIPGPVEVKQELLDAMSTPVVGHRTQEFYDLFNDTKQKLKQVFLTENPVLISTSSGTGLMEAAMRNLVDKKVLNCVCGSFSQRWHKIAVSCGKQTGVVEVPWGKAIKPEMIEEELSKGEYDAVCVTHNETSTGVMHDMPALAEVINEHDVLFLVDAVSSLGGIKLEVDELGIDMCITSSQKAFALPPGIAMASVSQKAFEKAEQVKNRGFYFDLLTLKKNYDKGSTQYTPSVSHIYALNHQLDKILDEGLENRFQRHSDLAKLTRDWARKQGLNIFPEKGFESNTVTCISNTQGFDTGKMKKLMAEKGFSVDSGYRKLNNQLEEQGKPTTFRIAHMGDVQEEDMKQVFKAFEEVFKQV